MKIKKFLSLAIAVFLTAVILPVGKTTVIRAVTSGYSLITVTSANRRCDQNFEIYNGNSSRTAARSISAIEDGESCVIVYASTPDGSLGNLDRWLVPSSVKTVSYLVVGGGGAGRNASGGQPGGAGAQIVEGNAAVGTNSVFLLQAGFGGYRGSNSSYAGYPSCFGPDGMGACTVNNAKMIAYATGGAAGGSPDNYGAGGAPPSNQPGLAGEGGFISGASSVKGGGGGTGACGSGGNATATKGGDGGLGCAKSITGSPVVYSEGGAGSADCVGCVGGTTPNGIGNGGNTSSPTGSSAGAPNYGSAGGGRAGMGATGAVILRYAIVTPPVWTDSSVSFGSACARIVNDGVAAIGTAPITYSVVPGGVLPKGLTFKSDGTGFTGTAEPSSYNFTLSASNAAGTIFTQAFSGSIQPCSDISIDSVSGPGSIAPGGTSTMTFVLANRAGPDAAPNATFTFRVPDNVTASPRGFTCTGTTTLTCSVGALPVSATASVSDRSLVFDISVASSYGGGTTSNGACSVSTTAVDINTANNAAACNFVVSAASADLRVTSWPDANEKTTYAPNSGGSRSFKIENLGPSDAANPTFSFVVNPSNISPTGVVTFTTNGGTAGNWTCSAPSGTNPTTLNCTSSTPMQKGTSIVAKVVTLADNSPNGTQVGSTATVGTSTTDPTSSNNSVSSMLMFVDLRPDLNISGNFESSLVVPGESTKLRIRVANGGSVASNGPTTVTFTLPAGLTLGTGDDVPTKCTVSGSTVTCTDSNGLAAPIAPSTPGDRVEFVLPVTVIENAVSASTISLTANVPTATTSVGGASGGETNTWNNSAVVALVVGPSSLDLAISVTRPASTNAGATATVLMTVTNNGPSSASGYTLRYDLPWKVTVSGALPSGCTAAGASIICTRATAFSRGSTESYSVTVLVDNTSLSGLTDYGSMEVNSTSIDVAPGNNKATVTDANLDVVALVVPTTTTTTSTTSTTTTVPKPVKKKVIPDTGFSTSDFLVASLWSVLFGAFLVDLGRRRRLRNF